MLRNEDILRFLGFNTQGDLGPYTFYTSKRKGLVFFQKSPPLEPPSLAQIHQRNKFRITGFIWQALAAEQRATWLKAAHLADLQITGYNLFTYYVLTEDVAAIETVERLARVDLIPLTRPA